MPVKLCKNGKFQIGTGPCVFDSKEKAERAYRGYLFNKYGTRESRQYGIDIPDNLSVDMSESVVDVRNQKNEDQKRLFGNE